MLSSTIVRLFGFPATLIFGDTLVLDRWLWLRRRLPRPDVDRLLIDVGCGSGAFSLGAAKSGYNALGLSWDERNRRVAEERARACRFGEAARFTVQDIRELDKRLDLAGRFDVAVCAEVIEHILDDEKLMADIARCLKPAGRLLLTTPNYHFRAITKDDDGPYSTVENGGHVRRGYTADDLERLCRHAGLIPETVDYCSGFLSQKITYLLRKLSSVHYILGWIVILPLRVLPVVFDKMIARLFNYPCYSICLVATKPKS